MTTAFPMRPKAEDPLGLDALDLPTPDEIRDLWDAIKDAPVPTYRPENLRRVGRKQP